MRSDRATAIKTIANVGTRMDNRYVTNEITSSTVLT